MNKINGLSAAIIITAPSLRAAASAIPGIGRTRAAQLRAPVGSLLTGQTPIDRFFAAEEAQQDQVTGRIKRTAIGPGEVALDLARALWRVALIDPAHALEVGVYARSRHVVSNSYSWAAEGAVVVGDLRWAPGHAPKGSIEYYRERVRSVSHGVGWEYRITTTGDKATGEKLKALKSWGGTITLREW